MPEYEEYIEEIKDIWDSHWLTNMGAKHNELEKRTGKVSEGGITSLFFPMDTWRWRLLIQALHLTGKSLPRRLRLRPNTCDRAERADAGIL